MTPEMEEAFILRMKLHRALVKENLVAMKGYKGLKLETLLERAENHDVSKYSNPERESYIWINWKYECKRRELKFDYPDCVEKIVMCGWQHHIKNNAHHPEAHDCENDMGLIDIVEMVCDWTAVNQEINKGFSSCYPWALEHINKKWNFSNEKKKLIFSTIEALDDRNSRENKLNEIFFNES